ncbi:CDP-glucose 4,6-dehydratase [Oleidesulfovibrio sp.]|uniref:CDP-glucose 4,6-dehydratase n=1 Tax=Oleidesulfovibrio sp. TaxID=2909707 RepID=UPI003A8A74CF
MFADVYRGARVLVTGHTGFKGSWLVSWLLELGATVAGFADGIPTVPSGYSAMGLEGRITSYTGDIRDRQAVEAAFADFQPQFVFHMAAQALVRRSYADPAATIATNAIGTMHVMEAVRTTPSVQVVVCITSDKCYRNDEWEWGYRETDHLGGDDPYSASKACAEIIAHSYMTSFFAKGPRCVTVRAGNVIGGGDWAEDRIVPDCARAWSQGASVSVRNPAATRPWQHVLEPLSGYLWLGARLYQEHEASGGQGAYILHGQAFNFGPSADVIRTVGDVVNELAAHWSGFTAEFGTPPACAAAECTLLKLCCDKALARLGWRAVLQHDETIHFTAAWYSRFYSGDSGDMSAFTNGQIAEYVRKAVHGGLPWTIS